MHEAGKLLVLVVKYELHCGERTDTNVQLIKRRKTLNGIVCELTPLVSSSNELSVAFILFYYYNWPVLVYDILTITTVLLADILKDSVCECKSNHYY